MLNSVELEWAPGQRFQSRIFMPPEAMEANEELCCSIPLGRGRQNSYVIDLAKQRVIDYYAHPGFLDIFCMGWGGEVDSRYRVCLQGTKAQVYYSSKNLIGTQITAEDLLSADKMGVLPLKISVQIPEDQTKRFEVGVLSLDIMEGDSLSATVEFSFINSRYEG